VDYGLCLRSVPGSFERKVPVLPFMTIRDCDKFVHDGEPCHRTKPVLEWLHQQDIQIIGPWPGNSPGLNPIEKCWRFIW
jgi:hypothetical protein